MLCWYYGTRDLYQIIEIHSCMTRVHEKHNFSTMASFRSPFFSLVVAIIAGVTSGQHCSVCGVGFRVGRPDAILSVQGHPDILCNRLEVAGFQGLIPIDECTSLPPLISEVCSCQANTAVERNRNRKLQSIPESNSPAAVTTKKPVTVSPVASPVVSPAYLFSGEWYCEVCDYYYESIKFPNKFVNFSNPNSTNVIQKQRCSELMGTQAACKYYATKIRRACGCEQFQAPAPAYWGSGEQPTTAEMPIGLYFFIIFSLLVLVSALCTVFKRASRLHAQERPTTVRRTPQEFSTLGHAIVVTNERREMGEEALKRRHLILSTLFPMEGKVSSAQCFVPEIFLAFRARDDI